MEAGNLGHIAGAEEGNEECSGDEMRELSRSQVIGN